MKYRALDILAKLGACDSAKNSVDNLTAYQAWTRCKRGDWLLWAAAQLKVDRRVLVRASCQCARLALKYVPAYELRPLQAIETAERWCAGKASIQDVIAAAHAAYAAAHAANAAANAAAHAAYAAANAAANAAAHAAYAAYAAANAAAHATHAAKKDGLLLTAKIIRRVIGWAIIAQAIKSL